MLRLLECEGYFGKQMQTTAVAHSPIVEITCPAFHLPGRHFGRVFDETGDKACLMDARGPEFLG